MKQRIRLLALGAALAVFAWSLPAITASAHGNGPIAFAQQQQGGQQPGAQEPGASGAEPGAAQEQQQREQEEQQQQQMNQQGQPQQTQQQQVMLTGKVSRENGHYLLTSQDAPNPLRISNPSKVKKYNGEMVKVEGTVNPKSHKLHVSKVSPATS